MPKTRRPTFIKEWREFRGLSQDALGELIGMTGANLSVLERGLINYTQDSLERIAGALDCSVNDLLSRAPKDSENLFDLWRGADARQRRQMIEIGKTILKPDGSSS